MLNKPKFNKSNNTVDISRNTDNSVDIKYDTDNSNNKKVKAENIISLDSSSVNDWLGGLSLMKDCIICREPKIHVDDMHKDNQLICDDCLIKLRKLIL